MMKTHCSAVVIGCGRIAGLMDKTLSLPAQSHAAAYRQNPDIEVVCWVDVVEEKAQTMAEKSGTGSVRTNFTEALQEYQPDVISICTPDDTHFSVVMEILKSAFPPNIIFLEKPACRTSKELHQMIPAARVCDCEILVNHSRRFDTKHQHLKGLIAEGFFGELIRGDVFYYSGWMHNGIHIVDTLNFLFGDEIRLEKMLGKTESPYEKDPTLDAVLKFKNNAADVFLYAFDEEYYQLFEFDFKFDRARQRLEDFGSRIVYEKKEVNHLAENVLVPDRISFPDCAASPLENVVNGMVQFLRGGNDDPISGTRLTDILPTMETLWRGMEMADGFQQTHGERKLHKP